MSTLAAAPHIMSNFLSRILSHNLLTHLLNNVKVSSTKAIIFTLYFSLTCSISLTTFSGLLNLTTPPYIAEEAQKEHLIGHPLLQTIVVAGTFIPKTIYLSIGSKCLAGKGNSSRFLIRGLLGFLTILPDLFLYVIPKTLEKSLCFSMFFTISSIVYSPSPLTQTSTSLHSLSVSISANVGW